MALSVDNNLSKALLLGECAAAPDGEVARVVQLAIKKFVSCSSRIFAGVEGVVSSWKADSGHGSGGDTAVSGSTSEQFLLTLRQSSRNFRSQLGSLLADIDLIASSVDGPNSFQHEFDLTTYVAAIWHLCEIFYLGEGYCTSLEMIAWLQMNGTPALDYAAALARFHGTKHPQDLTTEGADDGRMVDREDSDSADGTVGYWDAVFKLSMEGRLNEVWELLALHSGIADIVQTDAGSGSDSDRRTLRAVYDALTSHPYAAMATEMQHAPPQLPPNLSLEFRDWQTNVSRILQSNPPIVARIPELSTLLLLLLADTDTLVQWSHGDWTALAAALFLYKCPPPLTMSSINSVVGEVLQMLPVAAGLPADERAREVRLRAAIRDVLAGDLAPVLRSLVDLCGWGRPVADHSSLLGLLSVGHMTYLLAQAGSTRDGSSSTGHVDVEILCELLLGSNSGSALTATMPNEASFVEELFLESAQRLNALDFPVDVVVGYLHSCPRKGAEYARILLPRRLMPTDRAALEVSESLRALGLGEEAQAVEAARGSWWLQKGRCAEPGVEVVRALRFFQLAGDEARSRALLDRAWWRLCVAAVRLSQALEREPQAAGAAPTSAVWTDVFPLMPRGLRMLPMVPRGACRRGDRTTADFWDVRRYPESTEEAGIGGARTAVEATSRLLRAVSHAEQLLSAVLLPSTRASAEAACLEGYAAMVRALTVSRAPVTVSMNAQLVSIPEDRWAMMGGDVSSSSGRSGNNGSSCSPDVEEVMQRAANTLCGLISDGVAPMRFWLHLLDWVVAVDRLGRAPAQAQRCLFPKDRVYVLLAAAERAITWHAHYGATAPLVSPVAAADAQALRLGLLGLFTGAVVQANADAGANRGVVNASQGKALTVAKQRASMLLTASAYDWL